MTRRCISLLCASSIILTIAFGARASGQSSATDSIIKVTRAWPVMGTMFVATVWARDTAAALNGIVAARDSVRLIDSLLSTYRPESEASRVNARAGGDPARVSPQTLHVLLLSRKYWSLSGGLFDPTVGPLVRAWGFNGDSGRVPARAVLDSLRRLVGFDRVEIDSAASTVRLGVPGMSLDFGGIAKGYALDLARAALRDSTVRGGMLDLGGNVLVFGRSPTGRKWNIGIAHPRRDGRVIGVLSLDSGAVATSGDYEHFVRIDGKRYGHLLDPHTGYPRRGVLSATAIGPRGEMSDGLSAVYFLVGPARGSQLADSLPGASGVWVLDNAQPHIARRDIVRSARARKQFAY